MQTIRTNNCPVDQIVREQYYTYNYLSIVVPTLSPLNRARTHASAPKERETTAYCTNSMLFFYKHRDAPVVNPALRAMIYLSVAPDPRSTSERSWQIMATIERPKVARARKRPENNDPLRWTAPDPHAPPQNKPRPNDNTAMQYVHTVECLDI